VTDWTIARVADPNELVRSSHLFDRQVTMQGAEAFLSTPGHVVLLASVEGRGIGFVSGVEMRHPDKGPEMFAYELGVDASWRRRGVARTLLLSLRDLATERGCRGMWTLTGADNMPALATYRSLRASVDERSVLVEWSDLSSSD
jgi:ribosomal protein S18 acetylase RimI-like enzyme